MAKNLFLVCQIRSARLKFVKRYKSVTLDRGWMFFLFFFGGGEWGGGRSGEVACVPGDKKAPNNPPWNHHTKIITI